MRLKAADLSEINPRDLAYGETDGALSIRADVVAQRLNALLLIVQQMERGAVQCGCSACGVGWPNDLMD